ncbi:MAG: chromate resistance protein [Chloroflexi bacterium]|nr:MAG: chromate resistance protein [Chloroflexota bacterium]
MKWITREHVKVDRVACPWLIKKFVDKDAEFLFVPNEQVMEVAEREGAIPYDVKGVELGHHGKECSFEAILKKYNLTSDAALVLLGKIVNGADTDNTLWHQPEGEGLEAIAEGFRHLGFKDDHEQNAAEWIVYDALYAYCLEMVRQGRPDGAFKEASSEPDAGSINPWDRTGAQTSPKQ